MAANPAAKAKHRAAQYAAIDDQSWREKAACSSKHVSTDIFFDEDKVDQAKKVCAGCPVQRPCGLYGSGTGQPDGVWGGRARGERGRTAGSVAA